MHRDQRSELSTAAEERFAGYTVHDRDGDKIGKVDDLFVDENDQPEYIGVKMGFFGTSSTLIPMDVVTTDDRSRSLTVSQPKSAVKDGPRFDDDREITPDYERQVREYYGLTGTSGGENTRSGATAAIRLIDQLLAQDPSYDRETWPEIAEALDRDRPSHRKLFVD